MQAGKAKSFEKILTSSGMLIIKIRVKDFRSLFLLKTRMLQSAGLLKLAYGNFWHPSLKHLSQSQTESNSLIQDGNQV